VESVEEGETLREKGFRQPIVLLSGFHERSDVDTISIRRLCPVIHDWWQVEVLEREGMSLVTGVWVKVDTGMHRIGFPPDRVEEVVSRLESTRDVRIDGLMSHLSNADDVSDTFTRGQYRELVRAGAAYTYPLSLANSPAVLGWPVTHLDWVRPGMMLYGCSPFGAGTEAEYDLRPVMTLESRIIAVKTVPAGGAIGYGGDWICDQDTRVGVLACGYGDGYPRHAPSGTPVWVKSRPSRLLGRISMDLISIDLTGLEDVGVGEWAELWGRNVTASQVAERAGTIPYELVARVASRVPRVYES